MHSKQKITRKPSNTLEKSDKTLGVGSLAFAISGALSSGTALANEQEAGAQKLDAIVVEATLDADENPYAVKDAPYLSDQSGDTRRLLPLSKTPATINVLTDKFLADSGDTDLRDILDSQPGITLGTGEGGNSFGDRYIIRGHEARSDVFVDGLRDPGMTTRESFATQQIEISKGPSATFAGRGTTGGAVNSISKRASTEHDFTLLTGSVGTDNMHRATIDHNSPINDDMAVRLNLLHASEDVPDRAPSDKQRAGFAGSFIYEPTDELDVTLDLYHLKADEKSDLGLFYDRNNNNKLVSKKQVPAVTQDDDFLDSEINTATLRIGYEFDPDTRLTNLTRIGNTTNKYIITAATGFTTAFPTREDSEQNTNEFDTLSLETKTRWQDLEYKANQLNFQTLEELAGIDHELMMSFEISQYSVVNGNGYTYDTTGNCYDRIGNRQSCGTDPNGKADENAFNRSNLQKTPWRDKWSLDTVSLSAVDSVYLTDQTTLHFGLRYDHYDYNLETAAYTDRNSGDEIAEQNYDFEKGVWNGHLGASYDITPDLNLYAIYSTATNLNGGESDVGTNSGYGGFTVTEDDNGKTIFGEDEKIKSYELGAKWMLNDGKLLASAALFRIVKDDVVEGEGYDPNVSGDTPNTGKNQVQGLELGLAGNITNRLSVQAGIAFMESEILKTRVYEERDRDGRLTGNTINSKGQPLSNFADTSAYALVKYQLTNALSVGGSATYEAERFNGQPDTGASEEFSIPAYTVFDVFADYHIKKNFSVRLNVNNITDKEYYTAGYRTGKFVYLGDARNANITVNYKF